MRSEEYQRHKAYKCDCGTCRTCKQRVWSRKHYRAHPEYWRARHLGPDLDEDRLSAYCLKVGMPYEVAYRQKEKKDGNGS